MRALLILIACVLCGFAQSQVHGLVTDSQGDSLAFASIYVKGTTLGTTTNSEGSYQLDLKPGKYNLVFQYIGYQKKTIKIDLGPKPLLLNVVLIRENIVLDEVEITANAEDPAYAIIRKAIAKRKYYKDLVQEFSCKAYIKGLIKFIDAPEQIMGQEIGDLGGILDTNRQGIVYLSESESSYHFKQPNQSKEVMISSRVSGNDSGFSFNRAADMDFDLYENHITLGRQIITPIANNALAYYKYRLEGVFFDEDGLLINKIRVIPKREEDPVFRGVIYIVEDLWNLQSVELHLTGSAMKQPVFDTLTLKQVFLPVVKPDTWRVFSRTISFKVNFLGFSMGGNFNGIFSDYDLNSKHEPDFFSNEIFKVESESNTKTAEYWEEFRPIPLTVDEEKDYVRKDSLELIWESKEFQDSVDAKNNKFKPLDLLAGYTYENSYKKWRVGFPSPLMTFQFNPVQGVVLGLDGYYEKDFDEHGTRSLSVKPGISYGFSDNRYRWFGELEYQFNRRNFSQLTLEGGKVVSQFSDAAPVPILLNTGRALFRHENFLKLYEKDYFKTRFRRELVNGIFLRTSLEYSQRSPLVNHSDYSFRAEKDRSYEANDPQEPENYDIPSFDEHEAIILQIDFRLRLHQKYISYPNRKFILGSKIPDLLIRYKKGGFGKDARFDFLSFRVSERSIELGLVGKIDFSGEVGTFIGEAPQYFMDFKHFTGNQFYIANPSNYLTTFLLLPYYDRSTNETYGEVHIQHHFDGFILDKIPLLRKLGFTTVVKADWNYSKFHGHYSEVSVGLENFGFSIVRNMRLDFVKSFGSGDSSDFGIIFGIGL